MVKKSIEMCGPQASLHESDDDEPIAQAPKRRRAVSAREATLEEELAQIKQQNVFIRKYS